MAGADAEEAGLEGRAGALDRLLPQTQCRRCGYAGCRPYAQAMAEGAAPPNRCPPGGEATLRALADVLGVAPLPLDPSTGAFAPPHVVVIDEAACIGCAKCLPACPVDAIIGARRQLHTVLEAECSGCDLCVPACPVDCIEIRPAEGPPADAAETARRATRYRSRYEARLARAAAAARAREAKLEAIGARRAPGMAPP